MQLIKINNLKKYYGDRLILDIEDLEIFEGEKNRACRDKWIW